MNAKTRISAEPIECPSKMGFEHENRPSFRTYAQTAHSPRSVQIKKASRLLQDLSCDAQRLIPQLPVPKAWLLRALLVSHYYDKPGWDWRQNLAACLHRLKQKTHPRNAHIPIYDEDGKTPLFPNSDDFSLASTHLYASTMLFYLQNWQSQRPLA